MAYHQPSPASAAAASRPTAASSAPVTSSNNHPGTFAPGTKVQVGSHRVIVEKYLSEGGFAHVYVVNVPRADGRTERAVLKRVAVPDKEALANMRTEVETMKKLQGHKHIVTYMDSHASQLKGGGYEVFLLMEYCAGGGLIDFMNTRLKNRLTEPEILKIFSDAAEGVACMHYLKPPLLHRDLKVENILISTSSSSTTYKLCDFGSSAPPRPAAANAAEGRLIEEDVQRHTTLQYRSPEMIDVYLKKPIDEKSDIWALGVLLYKLCYYTTPFEQQGQMAIMNASYKYPAHPVFSDRLKMLIATMLTADPRRRPNVYEVLKEVCAMRGVPLPVKDIYSQRSQTEARSNQQLPPREPNVKSPPMLGATVGPPEEIKQHIPDVKPMRRGRPTSTHQQGSNPKPSPSPGRTTGDPFAALDSNSYATRSAAVDELSAKFPSVEQFSILQDKNSGFNFDSGSPKTSSSQNPNQKLTNALADEVFASSNPPKADGPPEKPPRLKADNASAMPSSSKQPDAPKIKSIQAPPIHQPAPKPGAMVSTGTMTSRPSSPTIQEKKSFEVSQRPIWRVPQQSRSPAFPPRFDSISSHRSVLREPTRSNSNRERSKDDQPLRSPVSSRPSLESLRPPGEAHESLHRSRSSEARPRMTTNDREEALLPMEDQHALKHHHHSLHLSKRPHRHSRRLEDKFPNRVSTEPPTAQSAETNDEDFAIESSVDYLRTLEQEESHKGHHRRSSATLKHIKHASMPSVSLSGTKNSLLGGRIGDAFRRFEGNYSGQLQRPDSPDSLNHDNESDKLTPSSTAAYVDDPPSYEDMDLEDMEGLSPEVRREIERRQLSQEERRVTEAAAAYRERVNKSEGGRSASQNTRATAIQNRVRSLLDESEKAPAPKRTAEGYGKYTGTASESESALPAKPIPPSTANKPTVLGSGGTASASNRRYITPEFPSSKATASAPEQVTSYKLPSRPAAPPKPVALRTGGTGPSPSAPNQASPNAEDLESDFSKRYPSLSLEMVETEIAKAERRPPRPVGRVKDV